jgi:hypothetical protein
MRLSLELQEALLSERHAREIDEDWIKGIRKGLKKLLTQTKRFKGRTETHKIDQAFAIKMKKEAEAALRNLQNYLKRFREDILFVKGFWTIPSKAGKKEADIAKRWKSKVVEELDAADEAVAEYLKRLEWLYNDYILDPDKDPVPAYVMSYHKRAFGDQEEYNRLLRSIAGNVDEAVEAVDAAISRRLLRHVSALLKKSPVDVTGTRVPIDFGDYEPEVIHIGPATVIFMDTPAVSPSRIGYETTVHKKGKGLQTKKEMHSYWGKPTEKGEVFRHPRHRASFANYIKKALGMLRARRLLHVAKGIKIFVQPKGRAHDNRYGAHLGVGGSYNRQKDAITVFSDAGPFIIELMAHELGHRYYYKYLRASERREFDKWFKEVDPVSEYGGNSPAEDFAEVFEFYVMGKKLTRDQRLRFGRFLGRKKRTESLSEQLQEAIGIPTAEWEGYQIVGMVKDEVDTCQQCGKHPIKKAVVLAPISGPGGEIYVGTTCAKLITKRDAAYIWRKAEQEQRKRDKEDEMNRFKKVMGSRQYRAMKMVFHDWRALLKRRDHEGAEAKAEMLRKRIDLMVKELKMPRDEVLAPLRSRGWIFDGLYGR